MPEHEKEKDKEKGSGDTGGDRVDRWRSVRGPSRPATKVPAAEEEASHTFSANRSSVSIRAKSPAT